MSWMSIPVVSTGFEMRKDWPDDCAAAIEYDETLEHLVWLVGNDLYGKEYGWKRAKELERSCQEMWSGIAEDLKQRVLKA